MMNTRTGLIPDVYAQVKIRLSTGMMKIIVALAALHDSFACGLLSIVFFSQLLQIQKL